MLSKAKPFYSSCFANEDRNSTDRNFFPKCTIQKIMQSALISFHHCFLFTYFSYSLSPHHLLHLFFSAQYTKLREKNQVISHLFVIVETT